MRRDGSVSQCGAYLLHDTSLSLGEGNVTTRLILDKLDLDLPSLATGLVVVIVVVVGRRWALAFGAAACVEGAVAIASVVVSTWRGVVVVIGNLVGHGNFWCWS